VVDGDIETAVGRGVEKTIETGNFHGNKSRSAIHPPNAKHAARNFKKRCTARARARIVRDVKRGLRKKNEKSFAFF
jgi:hypothetical protein